MDADFKTFPPKPRHWSWTLEHSNDWGNNWQSIKVQSKDGFVVFRNWQNLYIPGSVFPFSSLHIHVNSIATAPNSFVTCAWDWLKTLQYIFWFSWTVAKVPPLSMDLVLKNSYHHFRPWDMLSSSVISFRIKNMECWMPVKTSQSNNSEVNAKANVLSNNINEARISPLFIHHSCCSKCNTKLSER